MDSTPNPNPNPNQNLSLKSKLPIKRKISEPNPNPNLAPKLEHLSTATIVDGEYDGGDGRQPPFKFHRIWTEPDEIRFLQCLLDSTDLSFPRDLNLFYSRFSSQTATSHPYTRSQLYEKLRRLRKKFRVVSSRLARGAVLSPHDRALFDLSKRLWHPDFSSASPFLAGSGGGSGSNSRSSNQKNNKKSNLVGVRVSFSPTLEIDNHTVSNRVGDDEDFEDDHVIDGGSIDVFDNGIDVQLSEVNVELDNDDVQEQELAMLSGGGRGGGGGGGGFGGGIGEVVANTVMNVFDQSLKEVRTVLVSDLGSDGPVVDGLVVDGLEKRWREQRVAELDVLGRRLRLCCPDAQQAML
ncbi:probable transcription factor At3g04930 [Rhododendron vialii]|uniref:probable transcription factor At3g04930 n=1 Tax=Rhododendron vialii TaxID=182163 RepID=UPI00265FE10A|nr:probable transcription factor At3g04930 [Rhododendron vialii]